MSRNTARHDVVCVGILRQRAPPGPCPQFPQGFCRECGSCAPQVHQGHTLRRSVQHSARGRQKPQCVDGTLNTNIQRLVLHNGLCGREKSHELAMLSCPPNVAESRALVCLPRKVEVWSKLPRRAFETAHVLVDIVQSTSCRDEYPRAFVRQVAESVRCSAKGASV